MTVVPWEAELSALFPGWLLPESESAASSAGLSAEVAATFLERVSGNPGQLRLVRLAALFHAEPDALEDFAHRALPSLVARLPSRTEVERRTWEDQFHGRLDPGATSGWALRGQDQRFVTRRPRRRFDRPENVLVHTVTARLSDLATELLTDGGFGADDPGWVGRLRRAAESMRRMRVATVLREVPTGPIDDHHLGAARMAPHEAYAAAVRWAGWLEVTETTDPARLARLVAEAALLPASPDSRFELAVLLRLARSLERALDTRDPGRWRTERSCVLPNRRDVVRFVGPDAREIRLYYNQAVTTEGGARWTALQHYFGHAGRPRPDVTVEIVRDGRVERMVVLEAKRSDRVEYLVQGFDEAWVYRWEYARWLTAWPRAILVTSAPVPGACRKDDDVVAVGWDGWVPEIVLTGILDG